MGWSRRDQGRHAAELRDEIDAAGESCGWQVAVPDQRALAVVILGARERREGPGLAGGVPARGRVRGARVEVSLLKNDLEQLNATEPVSNVPATCRR